MALLLPLLTALVLCSFGPLESLGCDLPQNPVQLSRNTLVLLGQMRRISLVLCLKDRRDFGFPRHVVEGRQLQEAQAVSVLHEMLQQTFNLFVSEASSAAWNTTLLDQLHSGLHRQLEDLEACLVQGVVEEPSALAPESSLLALKGYFQGLQLYLKEKNYSDCAWEIVRSEILRSLSASSKLYERLRREDGGLGSF